MDCGGRRGGMRIVPGKDFNKRQLPLSILNVKEIKQKAAWKVFVVYFWIINIKIYPMIEIIY